MQFDLVCSKLDSLLSCSYLVIYCTNSLKTYNQIDLLKMFNVDIQTISNNDKATLDFIILMLVNFYNEEYIRVICKQDYFNTPQLEQHIRTMKEDFYRENINTNSIKEFLFTNDNQTSLGIIRNNICDLLNMINFDDVYNYRYLKYICDSEYRENIKYGLNNDCNIVVQNLNFDIINDFINVFSDFDTNINEMMFSDEYTNESRLEGGNIDITQVISVIRGETLRQNAQ